MMVAAGGSARYRVRIAPDRFPHASHGSQVVFHGINKSGSLAMSNTILEAFKWAGRPEEALSHYRIGGGVAEFKQRVDSVGNRVKFVVGHYLYGSLAPIPNRIWITQFRHPLPRILSCYQWLKNKHVAANGEEAGFPTLIDFVRATRGISHSQVVQFGCGFGAHHKERRRGTSAKDLYEISVDVLESSVYAIGIAEYFEESIFAFAALCELDSVAPWIRDNRNKGRPLYNEISSEETAAIEEVYRYDYKLYEYALARFWQQAERIGLSGFAELEQYKAACLNQYKDRIVGQVLPSNT